MNTDINLFLLLPIFEKNLNQQHFINNIELYGKDFDVIVMSFTNNIQCE